MNAKVVWVILILIILVILVIKNTEITYLMNRMIIIKWYWVKFLLNKDMKILLFNHQLFMFIIINIIMVRLINVNVIITIWLLFIYYALIIDEKKKNFLINMIYIYTIVLIA